MIYLLHSNAILPVHMIYLAHSSRLFRI